jgi:uncharacterized membrane protein (DUF485 family)
MTVGTIFTLFVLPSIYVLLAKEHNAEQAYSEEEMQTIES